MASINMASILAKAQACMNTGKKRNEVRQTVNKVMLGQLRLQTGGGAHTPEEAAAKFIDVLHNEIESSGLSANAIAAISNIQHGSAHQVGDNTYIISVYFADDLSRPSLDEAQYGSINNLAELFNDGVDHTMRPVHGEWHGNETWSRTIIPGTHFMEGAISNFLGNYGNEYNVVDIQLNR